jgi:hypothetical protein
MVENAMAMPVAVAMARTLLQLDGPVRRLDVDVGALLSDDCHTAGGAEDADAPVLGQGVLRTHFVFSLAHCQMAEV